LATLSFDFVEGWSEFPNKLVVGGLGCGAAKSGPIKTWSKIKKVDTTFFNHPQSARAIDPNHLANRQSRLSNIIQHPHFRPTPRNPVAAKSLNALG
jgi:hypothetical protein